jgi:hypothetical protein
MAITPRMNAKRWQLFALLLILLLATGLRLYRIDAQSLWYDEGASLRYAERTPAEIWRNTAADIHPPAYYVVLSGWVRIFGFSEFALRGLSALFGVLLIAQIYALGRKLFNPTVGLLAAALIAVDPFHVYYAQEARMYTLLVALGAASLWLFLRWLDAQEDEPSKRWLLLAMLAWVNAVAMYTHYIFPFFIAAESLFVLAWWLWESGPRRRFAVLGEWVVLQIATFLLYLPWLPVALRHVTGFPRAQTAFSPVAGALDMSSLLAYGITLPTEVGLSGLVALGLLALVGLFPPIDADESRPSFGWRMGLVLAWLFIPVAAMVVFKLYQGNYLRFILPADIALALLLARGLWMAFTIARPGAPGAAQSGWMRLIVVVVAAVGLAPTLESLSNLYFNSIYARDDYRAIAYYLQDVTGPNDAIILNGPNQWEVFTYYYPPTEAIYPLPSGDTEAELDSILATSERVYAIFYGENERDPERIVEDRLDTYAFEADTRWYGNVRFVTYGVSDATSDEPTVTLDAQLGEHIRLLGYTLDASDARPGGLLDLALYWETDTALDESYVVFVHLVDAGDMVIAQHDGVPGGGTVSTNTWSPGQIVSDHHGVLIPPDAKPGDYKLVVGLFFLETGERLSIALESADIGDRLPLSTVSLE